MIMNLIARLEELTGVAIEHREIFVKRYTEEKGVKIIRDDQGAIARIWGTSMDKYLSDLYSLARVYGGYLS